MLASQRGRLLRAMEELVGENGYESTTVPQVIRAARVSTATFYRFFTDKVDRFIALCVERGERLLAALTPDQAELDAGVGTTGALDRGLETYLRWWRENPAMARAYFLELPAAGPRAIAERDRQYERFAALSRTIAARSRARAGTPNAPRAREIDIRASVIVITELVASEIRRGRIEQLPELQGDLRRLLLKLLRDAAVDHEPES